MESQTEKTVPSEFDAAEFWDTHKNKVILYGLLLIGGLAAFVIYQISANHNLVESGALYQNAKTAEDYRRLIAQYPRSTVAANAHLLLAEKLRDERKYDDALEILRKLTSHFPEYPVVGGAWLSIGETLQAKGELEQAITTYQQVVAKYPNSYAAPVAQSNYAALLRSQGKIGEARQAYETLMSQFPESYFTQQAQQELQFLKE